MSTASLGVQADCIVCGALDLGGVFQNNQAIIGRARYDLREDRVGKRGLAGARATGDKNVKLRRYCASNDLGMLCSHHLARHIIIQRDEARRTTTDRE